MGLHNRCESHPPAYGGRPSFSNRAVMAPKPESYDLDLLWPFGKLEGIDRHDIRETAYEVFFTSCRSSPGFGGGKNALAFYSPSQDHNNNLSSHNHHGNGDKSSMSPGSPGSPGGSAGRGSNGVGMVTNSRIKKMLGLRTLKRMSSKRMSSGSGPSSTSPIHGHGHGHGHGYSYSEGSHGLSFTVPSRSPRRPLTSAEIMRVQMRVTEQSDNRLRKTLMRTLVGQMGRRTETIIIPLELLRHLKPSEFRDHTQYHSWQKRLLRILEAGLVLHPSIPLENRNSYAIKFREIVRAHQDKPIDTAKNSENMKQLCNCILSLAWRGANGNANDDCHWADGNPLNIHLYLALLESVFDLKDNSAILDEVDELLELMKRTWPTLGINRSLHNLCFTWVLFQQYVLTGQTEPDLLCATFTMLVEVANDSKRTGDLKDETNYYIKMLASVLSSIISWSEKKLLNYHCAFSKGYATGMMENLIPLVLQARKILDENIAVNIAARKEQGQERKELHEHSGNRVDYYIRSSLRNAFAKMEENTNLTSIHLEGEKEVSEALINLAMRTEELALKEKEKYSNILKRWHPVSSAIASVMLHNCYGVVLHQYLSRVSMVSSEVINVLHRAGELENILVHMVVEDTVECEDGGKSIVREMVPFEVDSFILRLLKKWIEDKLQYARDYVHRSKETETWNPKSKEEPFAQSAVELIAIAKRTIGDFFELPLALSEDLVQDLADGLEHVIREYASFVASCGTRQSYIPTPPPLTRCNRDSTISKLWKKAGCDVGIHELHNYVAAMEGQQPRPTTSRGTQRLYIRSNTLHYLFSQLDSMDKILSLSSRGTPITNRKKYSNSHKILGKSSSYFELAQASIQGSIQHVAEVSAYRLIFLDTDAIFYDSLYAYSVSSLRIRPVIRILKQNLTLLGAMLIDRAQPVAMKEVMRASFDAYLMILLAGGNKRSFNRSDFEMIVEDFESLKRVFCTSGMGLISEYDVNKEAEVVEGVIQLMGESSDQLIEDLTTISCEKNGIGRKLTMPPTTGRWSRSDTNTILRVLCHRNDRVANLFLKRTFQLPRRR